MKISNILQTLEQRRRELKMSYAVLARRTGLSVSTVQRILKGNDRASSINVFNIAKSMGVDLGVVPKVDSNEANVF